MVMALKIYDKYSVDPLQATPLILWKHGLYRYLLVGEER